MKTCFDSLRGMLRVLKDWLIRCSNEGPESQLRAVLNDRVTLGCQVEACLSRMMDPYLVRLHVDLTVGSLVDEAGS